MDSCFDLVGSRQHGVVSYEIFSLSTDIHILTKMVMTSDETQIQILAHWPGGGVLPYIGYIGMCGRKGYGFSVVLVINRVSILADFGHFGHK